MIVQFDDHSYIDIDTITMLKKFAKPQDKKVGFVIAGSGAAYLKEEEFEVIEKAFDWKYRTSMYNKELKLKSRETKKGDK